jgi:hypothetical protein
MADKHPFVTFCETVRVSPDTQHSDTTLALRYTWITGSGRILATEIAAMRADFRRQMAEAAVVDVKIHR